MERICRKGVVPCYRFAARQHAPKNFSSCRGGSLERQDFRRKYLRRNALERFRMDWLLFMWIVLLVLGLALLVKGADWFVDGSAGIAHKAKIPPLVIGLTIVAFGTSAPELAVSITDVAQGTTDICVGNVVGSNIANILLILGVASLVRKLPVQKNSLYLDLPVLLAAGALLVGLGAWGGKVQWWDGLVLLAVFIGYMTFLLVKARRELKAQKLNPPEQKPLESPDKKEEKPKKPKGKVGLWYDGMQEKLWFCILLAIVGLGMVIGGGVLFVDGAKYIAEKLGASERIIGLTVVAIGTSLPELVTSVVAAVKGETDIAVGNIIGSNIFNVLLIAGIASLIHPLEFSTGNLVDALVAFGASVLLFLFSFFDKRRLGIPAGVVFLCFYIAYYLYLFLMPV